MYNDSEERYFFFWFATAYMCVRVFECLCVCEDETRGCFLGGVSHNNVCCASSPVYFSIGSKGTCAFGSFLYVPFRDDWSFVRLAAKVFGGHCSTRTEFFLV